MSLSESIQVIKLSIDRRICVSKVTCLYRNFSSHDFFVRNWSPEPFRSPPKGNTFNFLYITVNCDLSIAWQSLTNGWYDLCSFCLDWKREWFVVPKLWTALFSSIFKLSVGQLLVKLWTVFVLWVFTMMKSAYTTQVWVDVFSFAHYLHFFSGKSYTIRSPASLKPDNLLCVDKKPRLRRNRSLNHAILMYTKYLVYHHCLATLYIITTLLSFSE